MGLQSSDLRSTADRLEWLSVAERGDILHCADLTKRPKATAPPNASGNELCPRCCVPHYGNPCYNRYDRYGERIRDEEPDAPRTLTSTQARLLQGLVGEERGAQTVTEALVSALCVDLVTGTAQDSAFLGELLENRTAVLGEVANSLRHERYSVRANIMRVPDKLEGSSTVLQLNIDLLCSVLKAQTASITSAAAAAGIAASPITPVMLDKLEMIFDQPAADSAKPTLLELVHNPEAEAWASPIVEWLVTVIRSTQDAPALQDRAIAILLQLILRLGSLRTALRALDVFLNHPSSSPSPTTAQALRDFLNTLSTVSVPDSVELNTRIADSSGLYCGSWKAGLPNFTETGTGDDDDKADNNNNNFGRKRGFIHRRGRRMRRRYQDDADEEQNKDESQPENYSSLAVSADGAFVYVHSQDGLHKVGTGSAGSRRGRVYAMRSDFCTRDQGWLCCVRGVLIFRKPVADTELLVLSADTLEDVPDAQLALPEDCMPSVQSPIVTCGERLYVVRQLDGPTDFEVCIFALDTSAPALALNLERRARLGNVDMSLPRQLGSCARCARLLTPGPYYACPTCEGSSAVFNQCYDCQRVTHRDQHHKMNKTPPPDALGDFPCWYHPKISGNEPSARFAAASCAGGPDGNLFFIFGGGSGHPLLYIGDQPGVDMLFNDLIVLNTADNAWVPADSLVTVDTATAEPLEGECDAPTPRLGSTLVALDANRLMLFGGSKDDTGLEANNELFIYHIDRGVWTRPHVSGTVPGPRTLHGVCMVDRVMFVFGGMNSDTTHSDLFQLDTNDWKWSQVQVAGTIGAVFGPVVCHIEEPLSSDVDGIRSQICVIGGGNAQQPSWACQYIDLRDRDEGKPLRWKTMTSLSPYCHYLAGSAHIVQKDRIYVFGGGHNGSFTEQVSRLRFGDPAWEHYFSFHGTPPSRRAYASFAAIGNKLYVFGGGDDTGCKSQLSVFHTSTDPSVPLTAPCLREALFFTDGHTLNAHIPPLLPPNVVVNNEYITRTFALDKSLENIDPAVVEDEIAKGNVNSPAIKAEYDADVAPFLFDHQCSSKRFGGSIVFDRANNLIWVHDRATQTLHRWVNTAHIDAITLDLTPPDWLNTSSGALTYTDASARLLHELARMAGLYTPNTHVLDPVRSTADQDFEPFVVDTDSETFDMLARLLEHFADAAKADQRLASFATQCVLKILLLNVQRVVNSEDRITAAAAQRLTAALQRVDDADCVVLVHQVFALGLRIFFPYYQDRAQWLCSFFEKHGDNAELASWVVSRVTSSSFVGDVLAPHSWQEGRMPVRAAVPENKDDKAQTAFAKRVNELVLDKSTTFAQNDLVVLQHAIPGTHFYPMQVVIGNSSTPNIPGLGSAMLFVAETAEELNAPGATAPFDDFTHADYDAWLEAKLASGEPFTPLEPIAFIDLADSDHVKTSNHLNLINLSAQLYHSGRSKGGKVFGVKFLHTLDTVRAAARAAQQNRGKKRRKHTKKAADSDSSAKKVMEKSTLTSFNLCCYEQTLPPHLPADLRAAVRASKGLALLKKLIDMGKAHALARLSGTDSALSDEAAEAAMQLLACLQLNLVTRAHDSVTCHNSGEKPVAENEQLPEITAASFQTPLFLLLVEYMDYLFAGSQEVAAAYAQRGATTAPVGVGPDPSDDDAVDESLLGELRSTLLGRLLPPLVTALHPFTVFPSFAQLTLPAMQPMMGAVTQVCSLHAEELQPFEESYMLPDSDARVLSFCVARCRQVRGDAAVEEEEEEDDEAADDGGADAESVGDVPCHVATCDHKARTAHGLMRHIKMHHLGVAKTLGSLRHHWALDLLRTLGTLCARSAASLTIGNPASESEELQGKWLDSPLFQQGLQLSALLPRLEDLEKRREEEPILRGMERKQALREARDIGAYPALGEVHAQFGLLHWETADDVRAKLTSGEEKSLAAHDAFLDDFVHARKDGKTHGAFLAEVAPGGGGAAGRARFLMAGGGVGMQGSMAALKHTRVHEALRYVIAAVLKVRGLVPEAMTFAHLLAVSGGAGGAPGVGKLRSIPKNLRPVWQAARNMLQWISRERQEQFARWTMMEELKKAQAQKRREEERRRRAAEGHESDSDDDSGDEFKDGADDPEAEAQQAEEELDIYAVIANRIIAKAALLLKVRPWGVSEEQANKSEAPSAGDAASTAASSDGTADDDDTAMPQLRRAVSADPQGIKSGGSSSPRERSTDDADLDSAPPMPRLMRSLSTAAPSEVTKHSASVQRRARKRDILSMWKSILHPDASEAMPELARAWSVENSPLTDAAARAAAISGSAFQAPELDPWRQPYGRSRHLPSGREGRNSPPTELILFFLQNEREVDPAAESLSDKKIEADPTLLLLPSERRKALNVEMVEQLLLDRRARAYSRAAGLQAFQQMLSGVGGKRTFRSVVHLVLCHLLPALRGEAVLSQREKYDDQRRYPDKYSKYNEDGTEKEDANKSEKQKSEEAARRPFRYTDGTLGCGADLTGRIRRGCKELFFNLTALLKASCSAMSVSLAGPMRLLDARTPSPTPAAVAPQNDPSVPSLGFTSKREAQRLALALLGAWAMRFTEEDHAFLHRCGVLPVLRRLMSQRARGATGSAPATQARAGSDEAKMDDKLRALARSAFLVLATRAFDARSTTTTKSKALETASERLARLLASDDEDDDNDDDAGSSDTTRPLNALQQSVIELTFSILDECSSALYSESTGASKTTDIDAMQSRALFEESSYGMLGLIITVCERGGRAAVRYISTPRLMRPLLFMMERGTPRMQRYVCRLMRKLLPEQHPRSLTIGSHATALDYLIDQIGSLLVSEDEQPEVPKADAAASSESAELPKVLRKPARTAGVRQALASELVALVRSLMLTPTWLDVIQEALANGLSHLPTLLSQGDDEARAAGEAQAAAAALAAAEEDDEDDGKADEEEEDAPDAQAVEANAQPSVLRTRKFEMWRATAALCIIGGMREPLRVGGTVEVFASNNPKKRKRATLLSHDSVTGTASVVYDASVTKLVEDLPKNSRIVAQDEIPFDPRLFPLTSSSTELLEALRMLLAQAAAGERDSTASTVGGGDDDDDLMPEELVRATSASSSMVAPAEQQVQKQPTLALLHLRSRAMRALWSLLLHKESAVTLLEAGVGPDLTTAAHSSSPQVLSDPQQMEVAEHALSQLMQLCAQRGLTHRRIAGSGAERAFQLQAERLPHNPYNTWRCVLPSSMTTTSKKLTVEGEDRCVVLSNRRLREWEDYCPAWSTVAIPDEIPSFYYEITHVNPHENGYTMMGFYAADKPFRGELGSTPGSVCLTSDGWGSHATAGGGGCSSERWQQGDVIGAGWDKRTGRVFFTQNGKLVKCTYTLSERKRYHPAIVISAPGARFLFNFGQQPFRFNFAESKYFPKTKEEMKGSGAADTNGVSVSAGSGKTVDRAAEARARAKKKAASSSGSPDPEAEFEAMLMKKKQGGMEALAEEEPKKGGGADGGDDGGDAPSGPAGAQPAPAQGAPAPAAAGANAGAAPPAPGTPAAAAATGAPAGADGAPAAGADGAAANGQQPQDAQQGQPAAQTQQAEEEEEEEPPARNNNNNNLGNESDFEDDAASVEEDPDQNNNRYYDSDDEYDEYGNKKDKNARKPLGNEEVFVGATLMVHKSSEGQQSSNRSNPQFAWRPEMQATIGRSGTVLHVDRGSRMVMLSIVFPETAEEVHYWYSMSCLCKVDRFVNADLDSVQSLNSMDSKDILLRTADTELSLSVAYVRHALMSVLAFWPGDQQEDRARRAKETEAKAEVDPGVFRASFVGGAEELLHVLNRVALDELGDTSKSNKKAAKQVQAAVASVQTLLTLEQTELSHDTGGKDALIAPHDVASRNPLAVLGRLFWRMLTAEDADEQLVRLLAREAMHEAQHAKLDGGDDDWVRKLHQLQHVRYTCWLLNLLMTAHETDPESEQCARIAQYVYNADVATLLIGLLEPNRDAKKFKMTAVFSSVAQVLSRLLGRVDLFPVEQLVEPKPRFYVVDSDGHKNLGVDPAEKDAEVVPPGDDQPSVLNLDSLNWLIELMNGRHKIETANTPGSTTEPHSARSKTLQILVNSVLVLEQAKEDVRAKLAGGKVVAPVEVEKEVEKEVEEEEEEDGKEPSDDEDDDDDEEKADSDDDEEKEDSDEEEEEEEAAAEATKTTDKAEDDVPFESLQIGANFHELGWFERVEHVSQLMKRLLHQGGFPDWMARASWLDSQKHNLSVTRESEHPYVKDVEWSKIEIPHAEKVTVRLHSKSSTDGSDFLRFAAEPPASDGRQPALLGNLSGTEMNLPDDRLEVEGNCVWFSFSQSQSPTHAQCFCSHCEYPIKGKRYVCAVCKGDFNFCEACERNNMDEGRHDRSHILFQVRRPVPRDYEVPRVLPRLESFYEKDMIRKLNAGFQDDKAPHPGTSCSGCGQSPIVGVLHKCVSCEGFELCSGCEKELHREATPDAPRTLEHDLAHIFVKIRYPVKTLRPVANAPLSQFIESFQSTHVQWGFSFTVVPTFPASYQKQLLDKHAQDVARVVQEMTRDGPDMQAANRQVVELVNRACSKRTASNAPKVPQRGNRRRRHHNRGAVAERHVEREYLPLIMPPSDMASNQKDLVMYTQLESMEMEMVHQQFGMLRLLNERLLGVLPLINWGAVEDKWTLSHVFGRLRGLIFWEMKVKLWLSALSRSVGNSNSNRRVQLDNVKASQAKDMAGQSDVLDVIESSLFGQLYSQLRSFPASGMRTQGGQPWTTRYKQESGVDAGGLFRDSLTQICTELQSPHIPLFIPCPNARHSVGITLDKNLPHSGLTAPIYMSMYEFVGKLMGVAIRCSNPLSLDLPSLVWKTLVGTEPDRSDVQAIDEICVKAMDALLNERELREKGVNEDNFQDVYGFTFTYSASDETIVELKENGRNTPVTWADRQEYADLVIAMRLQELKPQMQALRRGLIQVIPARFLSLLTWKELELEVCGSPEIDIDLLKTNTVYSGCGPSDQHIKHFWEVLEEFTQLERAQFLRFVWGRSRLPPANKFTEKFKIHATSMSTAALPCSHTCFATLELPAYPTKEILRNKLYLAITMCTSIDNV